MTSKRTLKTSFAVDQKQEAFYTGGQVLFTEDGHHMLCRCTDKVNVLDVETGSIIQKFGQEEDGEVTCFLISPDKKILILALHNLLLKQFDFETRELMKQWRAIHTSPVSSMAFDCSSTLLATGGSDSTIKVWDVIQQYCTHNLKGHRGVISTVKYHPDPDKLQLFSGGDDYNIRIWNLQTSTCMSVLEGHYSVITGLQFSPDAQTLYSCGRDQVVNVWNLNNLTKTKTIPIFETVEAIILLPSDEDYPQIGVQSKIPHFITAGSKGTLRVWNAQTSQCVHTQNSAQQTDTKLLQTESLVSTQSMTDAIYCPGLKSIATVSYDHNITLFNLHDLSLKKQFAGYNDEVLDIKYLGKDQTHIVVATNSELIKVFDLKTWDVQMLHGHTDIVLALDVYKDGHLFASSSKDNTIRLWLASSDVSSIQCVAAAYGHTKEILSIGFSRLSAHFLASASEDLTIKVWTIPDELSGDLIHLNATITEKAHDKDINSIVISPNDKLIATGSQDKTAKLWNAQNLALLATLRGHKRGVWCVQFSPIDQCLATSSSDGSVKIWSLSDFTCVRTFEGHDALVLNVQFINRGMQLVTSGSDGLMKLWTIKTSECVKTFDQHQSKIWALTVSRDELHVITGAADSTIIVWKDVTDTELDEQRAKQVEFILKEQELMNLIKQKKYIKALALAINLEQPFRVLTIMKEIMGDPEGEQGMKQTLAKLRQDQLGAVLRFASQWNTNSKHCHVAQFVVMTVLQSMSPEVILQLPNAKSTIEAFLPYTEKHFERMNRLLQQSMFVQYTWNTMRLTSEVLGERSLAVTDQINLPSHSDITQEQSSMELSESEDSSSELNDIQHEDSARVSQDTSGSEEKRRSSSKDSSNVKPMTKFQSAANNNYLDCSQETEDGFNEMSSSPKQDLSMKRRLSDSCDEKVDSDEESDEGSVQELNLKSLPSSEEISDVTEAIVEESLTKSPRKSDCLAKRRLAEKQAFKKLTNISDLHLEKENKLTPQSSLKSSQKTAKTEPKKLHRAHYDIRIGSKKLRKSLS